MTIASASTEKGSIFFADGTWSPMSPYDSRRGFIQYDHSGDYMSIGTNADEAVRIDSSGNVGIGTTGAYSFKLQVAGDVGPDADNTYNLGSPSYRWANLYAATTTIGGTIVIGTDSITGSGPISISTNSGDLVLTASGDVYIGNQSASLLNTRGDIAVGTDDDFLYFDDGSSEYLMWDESNTRFIISNLLEIGGTGTSTISNDVGDIVIDPAGNNVLPGSDNTDSLGSPSLRWANLYAATTTVGDLVFGNEFKIVETDSSSTSQAIILKNQRGEEIMRIDEDGNMTITGELFTFANKLESEKKLTVEEDKEDKIIESKEQTLKERLAGLGLVVDENGVLRVRKLRAEEMICVGETCINEEQLKKLLERAEINETQDSKFKDQNHSSDLETIETYIESHPDKETTSKDATFVFSSNIEGATFQCQINNLGWEPCQSPKEYVNFAPGKYIFEVYAVSPSGQYDQTPEKYEWEITEPETQEASLNTGENDKTGNQEEINGERDSDKQGDISEQDDTTEQDDIPEEDDASEQGDDVSNNIDNSPALVQACDAQHLDLCLNETECVAAGGYWYDERCNSQCRSQTFYFDADGDGYGDPNNSSSMCSQPNNYVNDNTDCNDNDSTINPESDELCNDNIDNNCNGQIDENCSVVPVATDTVPTVTTTTPASNSE